MTGRRSKLELYVHTIEALTINGSTSITGLTLKAKISSSPLKAILSDLVEKKLVEERKLKRSVFYVATPRAKTVLSQLEELNQIIPIA